MWATLGVEKKMLERENDGRIAQIIFLSNIFFSAFLFSAPRRLCARTLAYAISRALPIGINRIAAGNGESVANVFGIDFGGAGSCLADEVYAAVGTQYLGPAGVLA